MGNYLYTLRRGLAHCTINEAQGGAVASFSIDKNGQALLAMLKDAMARRGGCTLYDGDSGLCLIGDAGQLVADPAPVSGEPVPAGFIVMLDTDHFSFEAHGRTEEEANETMGRALARHGEQYRLPRDWSDPYLSGFETHPFNPGTATRDGEEIR